MFVPGLPSAALEFNASIPAMQMTISLYIFGLALGQLIYGPLSDAYGRRPILLIGLGIYTVSGILAAMAPSVDFLIFTRLLQALGGAAGLVLGRAMVRDTTIADEAVAKLAVMNLMIMIGPGLAPVIGGLLSAHVGWRSIFVLLASIGLIAWIFSYRLLTETGHPGEKLDVAIFINDYKTLLSNRSFMGFALGGSLTTTTMYSFVSAAPFIFVTDLHATLTEVGVYLSSLILGIALGNTLTGRLIRKVNPNTLLKYGIFIIGVSASALLFIVYVDALTIVRTVGLMMLFTFGVGMSSPIAMTKAISVNPLLTGSASGLYGFIQMSIGALSIVFVGLGKDPAIATGLILTAGAVLGSLAFQFAIRKTQP
jgi:DHA1 family bicyclomycin/chloramphenicol resistance-like MFS transporter